MTEIRPAVLVVEDDARLRETLADVLTADGYAVTCAAHGAHALECLATGQRPRLILLDLSMRVMDGREFLAAQRALPALAQIPVVVLTGIWETAGLDVAEVLHKPVDLDTFLATVDRHALRTPR